MNCKPGDLAIIIRAAPMYADWISRIVSVERPSIYAQCWNVRWEGSEPESCIVAVHDNDLRPVSGLPLQEDTDIATHLHTSHTTGTATKAPA